MKATIPQIKAKINRNLARTGLVLSTKNPYWANAEQIKEIKETIEWVKAEGESDPKRRIEISETQYTKLQDWLARLEYKYLLNL